MAGIRAQGTRSLACRPLSGVRLASLRSAVLFALFIQVAASCSQGAEVLDGAGKKAPREGPGVSNPGDEAGGESGIDAGTAPVDGGSSDAGVMFDGGVGPLGCPPGSGRGPLGGTRPATLKLPSDYTDTKRYPLVIELHGRGGTGADAEAALRMKELANANQLLVISPDGSFDAPPAPTAPATFWNATDACCNLYNSTVDDVAYLRSLICHTQANFAVDRNKVFIIGQSNGAFMAHRMACDAADLVTGIIALSGVTWNDPAKCKPAYPVSVLQIHGTADAVVPYNGAATLFPGPSPSVPATYEAWARLNGCTGDNVLGPTIDFDRNVGGNETVTVSKPMGGSCKVATQLWAITGGSHTPNFSPSYRQFFIDWMKAAPPNHP